MQSSSIHFLKTKLCVACVNGFEIIDPETLDTQGLLDPSDESLEFVKRRGENVKPKPMAIYRIENEFLLCYDGECARARSAWACLFAKLCGAEFAFYINRNGWRSRRDFMVHWEGAPTRFGKQTPLPLPPTPLFARVRARALTRRVCGSTALQYPFVLAFEPTFVEIRNVETGAMSQIIQGNNLRCLFADTPPTSAHGPPPPPPPSQRASYAPYPPAGYGVQYGQQQQAYAQASYGARQSMQSVYGQQQQQQQQPGTPPYGPLAGAGGRQGRGEIIMVSDDRVMALRMASPG